MPVADGVAKTPDGLSASGYNAAIVNKKDTKTMTPEKRERRIARFEAWGIERVKADLLSGGHRLIGGTREVRELAHEWVRMKEAEAKATKDEVLLLKPQFMGLGLDLKAAGRKFASQLKKWRG